MEILYSRGGIIVCEKPVGADSEHEFPAMLAEAVGHEVFPIHRLDKNVGGLMLFADDRKSAARLSDAVVNGEVKKEYVACVHGTVPETGAFRDLLFKDGKKNKVFVVKKMRRGVKEARLDFVRTACENSLSLVRIRLHTGRSHQIRVQFASRGFPLVGDGRYGARDGVAAPMLYSCRITFPVGDKTLTFEKMPSWANEPLPLLTRSRD